MYDAQLYDPINVSHINRSIVVICLKNENTTCEFAIVDGHVLRVLQVDSVCIWAVTGRRNSNTENLNRLTIIEFEVSLLAVLDRYTRDRYIRTSVKPDCLHIFIYVVNNVVIV